MYCVCRDVFMGMDVRRRPIVADYDGGVVFYTDEAKPIENVILLEEAKKKITEPTPPAGTEDTIEGGGDIKRDPSEPIEVEEPIPAEKEKETPEETGDDRNMEDIKERFNVQFFVPPNKGSTIDLAITIRDKKGKQRLAQLIEGVPLMPTRGNN